MNKQHNQILIVDDDLEDHVILLEYFVDAGFDTDLFCFKENGQLALEYLHGINDEDELPNLIVLDLNMPVMNGTQTLLHLKQDSRLRKIPVMIFSTSSNEQERRKCFSFGAIDYMVKPMTYEEGQAIVQKFSAYLELPLYKHTPDH